jgi:ech hydrogenase subunit F
MFKMTHNILSNLISPRATRRHPYVVRAPFENSRGELYNEIADCNFCSVCAVKCPSQCITVDKKSATWSCNPYECIFCGVCVESCPTGCLRQKGEYRPPTAEMATLVLQGEVKKDKKKIPEPSRQSEVSVEG